MHFTAGTLKAAKRISHKIRAPFTYVTNGRNEREQDGSLLPSLLNLPVLDDIHLPLSPLDAAEFGQHPQRHDMEFMPLSVSNEVCATKSGSPTALWSQDVGIIVETDASFSPIVFSTTTGRRSNTCADGLSEVNEGIWNPRLVDSVAPATLSPIAGDNCATPSSLIGTRSNHSSVPELVTNEPRPLRKLGGTLELPGYVPLECQSPIFSRGNLLPLYDVEHHPPAFLEATSTNIASTTSLRVPSCIIQPFDTLGPLDLIPGKKGFLYCDPGAVNLLETIASRAVPPDMHIEDDIIHSGEFVANFAINLCRVIPVLPSMQIKQEKGSFVEYLGLCFVRIPGKYLSSRDWDRVAHEIQSTVIERYAQVVVSLDEDPIPGRRLSEEEVRRLYMRGNHVPLIELFPITAPGSPFIDSPPRPRTSQATIRPTGRAFKNFQPPPCPPSALDGIPESVARFIQLASDKDFDPVAYGPELELAAREIREMKWTDRQSHDRCLGLVLKHTVVSIGRCDVSMFVNDI